MCNLSREAPIWSSAEIRKANIGSVRLCFESRFETMTGEHAQWLLAKREQPIWVNVENDMIVLALRTLDPSEDMVHLEAIEKLKD